MLKKAIATLLVLAFMSSPSAAQDQSLVDIFSSLVEDNASGYLAPLPTAVGLAMNSATFQRAAPHKILGFDATVSVGAIIAPTGGNTYNFILPDLTIPNTLGIGPSSFSLDNTLLFPGDRTANNVFGDAQETIYPADRTYAHDAIVAQLAAAGVDAGVIVAADATILSMVNNTSILPDAFSPAGLGFGGFPIIVPQISIGLPMSIEVSFRGGVKISDPEIGDLSFTGFGGKIGLNGLLPSIPLIFPAISVGFYTTNLTIESAAASLEATNSIINFQISKSIPLITVYGGIGLESSTLKASYDLDLGTELGSTQIQFKLAGENSFRTTVGVRLKLLLLTFHGAYVQAGDYTGVYGGIGLTLR